MSNRLHVNVTTAAAAAAMVQLREASESHNDPSAVTASPAAVAPAAAAAPAPSDGLYIGRGEYTIKTGHYTFFVQGHRVAPIDEDKRSLAEIVHSDASGDFFERYATVKGTVTTKDKRELLLLEWSDCMQPPITLIRRRDLLRVRASMLVGW